MRFGSGNALWQLFFAWENIPNYFKLTCFFLFISLSSFNIFWRTPAIFYGKHTNSWVYCFLYTPTCSIDFSHMHFNSKNIFKKVVIYLRLLKSHFYSSKNKSQHYFFEYYASAFSIASIFLLISRNASAC